MDSSRRDWASRSGLAGVRSRFDRQARLAAGLLVAPPLVPTLAVGLRFSGLLPLGRLLVRTTLALVPFGLGWAALGWHLSTVDA